MGQITPVNRDSVSVERGKGLGKPRGTEKGFFSRRKKMRTVYAVAALLIIICVGVTIVASLSLQGPAPAKLGNDKTMGGSVKDNSRRAALIDPLYATDPNVGFTNSLNRTLWEEGITLEAYRGAEVTVDFLEKLAGGYRLLILRMHSALSSAEQLYLFTAEPYSSGKYAQEQYFQLVKEAYATDSSQPVFAVNWGFVERLMKGKFDGTLVIVMGCDGANDPYISEEFIKQGAVGYVGWKGPVLLSHSDEATLHLIEDLIVNKQALADAVAETNSQVGPDPASGSTLECRLP
jgi:hypothetical protein